MKRHAWCTALLTIVAVMVAGNSESVGEDLPDIRNINQDLVSPRMNDLQPAAGRRVRLVASDYRESEVYHCLYLPTDWREGGRFPVIVEYAGNGPFRNEFGDVCSGRAEDCNLGYGISGGKGFIWVCLPYISRDHKQNQLQWWGDVEATVAYCQTVVPQICKQYGGDPTKVLLAGFSRGSIACNYVGLYDDEIASLWCGFVCHSHYDGVRRWGYAGDDRDAAAARLKRLKGRPQFISHEGSVGKTRSFLEEVYPDGNFTYQAIPFRNHTDAWVLCDIAARRALREWVSELVGD